MASQNMVNFFLGHPVPILQATFASFVPQGEGNNFAESLFSGIAGPESFGNEVMLGISLNIQETIGHKAREGISYIIHTG